MNEYWQYIILALIQGFTEILPISSSGHLVLASDLLNLPTNDLSLSIFLHLASALAVIIYYRKRIKELLKGFFLYIFSKAKRVEYQKEFGLVLKLLIATVPAGVAGVLLGDYIERYMITPFILGACFLTTGLLLVFSTQIKKVPVSLDSLKYQKALNIGLFQMIGILPGISRSGITYVGTRANSLNAAESAEFIFLLFLPISLGSGFIESLKLINTPTPINIFPLLIASVIAVIATLISLKLFLSIIKREKMHLFSYYLLPLGLFLMAHGLYVSSF